MRLALAKEHSETRAAFIGTRDCTTAGLRKSGFSATRCLVSTTVNCPLHSQEKRRRAKPDAPHNRNRKSRAHCHPPARQQARPHPLRLEASPIHPSKLGRTLDAVIGRMPWRGDVLGAYNASPNVIGRSPPRSATCFCGCSSVIKPRTREVPVAANAWHTRIMAPSGPSLFLQSLLSRNPQRRQTRCSRSPNGRPASRIECLHNPVSPYALHGSESGC